MRARLSWVIAGLLCACERAPTRLERVSQTIEVKAADEALERGRAALKQLQPRTIAPPPARADSEYAKVSLVVSGALDERSVEVVKARLESLRLAGAVDRSGEKIAVFLPEAPREQVPIIAAAIGAQGKLQVARFEAERRREDVRVDDPTIRWTPLPVAQIEQGEPSYRPGLTAVLAPEGGSALAQATGKGGFLAVAFDELVLLVARVDGQVAGGRLTLADHAQELGDPRGALPVFAAALAEPSAGPLKVEVEVVEDAPACIDQDHCRAACFAGSGRACLRVAGGGVKPQDRIDLLTVACGRGASDGCMQLCTLEAREHCDAAIALLNDAGSVWSEPVCAAALSVERCRKGELAVCTPAAMSLIMGQLGSGDFVTIDAMLREIREETLLLQVTMMRKWLLDQAREMCFKVGGPEEGVGACLFVARELSGTALAAGDPTVDDALRQAGKFLREIEQSAADRASGRKDM